MIRITAILFLFLNALQADIVWNIEYQDIVNNTGLGFDDSSEGLARRNTITEVTNYLNSVLDYDGTVDLFFQTSETDGNDFLASAGALYPLATGHSNGLVYEHLNLGFDLAPSHPDGVVTFDFGYNWNTGLDTPVSQEFDMFTVALHEISHTLGFSSLVNANGLSDISGTNPGSFGIFDTFIERGDGTKLFDGSGTFLGTTADLVSGDLYFGGENAKLANGGQAIKLYAPPTFEDGSSVSHLDYLYDSVMNPGISTGVMKREYSAVDLGILKDLGYQILDQAVAVPEPKTGAFLVFVGVMVLMKRRKEVLV